MCVKLQKDQSRDLHLSILGLDFFSFLVKSTYLREQLSMETDFLSSLQSGKAWSWLLKWLQRLENRYCTALVYVPGFRHLAGYCSAYGEARGRIIPTFVPELSSHSAAFYLVLPFPLTFSVLSYFPFFIPLYNYVLFSFFFFISALCIILITIAKSLKRASFLSCRVRLFGEVVCDEWFPETMTWWSHGTSNAG